jgi:hypothetical protein
MKKSTILIMIILSCLPGIAFSENYIIRIGAENYTYTDMMNIMNANGFSVPDQAIEALRNEQVVKGLKSKKEDVYAKFFGKDAGTDAKYANHPEIILKSKQAIARLSIFDEWFLHRSEKVDVIYLDIEGYWNLVKKTESYRSRELTGRKLDYSSVPYTAAELRIDGNKALVLKDGTDYILAPEYNDYVNENYEAIRDFAKRDKNARQVKSLLIGKMTSEKIIAEKTDISKSKIDAEIVSKYIDRYCASKMFDGDLSLGKSDFLSPATIRAAVFDKYKVSHSERLNKVKEILEGKASPVNEEYPVKAMLESVKLDSVRSSIAQALDKEKVESWMKANKFPGSAQEAAFVMMNDEYERVKEEVIKENNIVFNDFN